MNNSFIKPCFYVLAFFSFSCNSVSDDKKENTEVNSPKLFTEITSASSGIHFNNTLEETIESNYYQYMYTYIGAGVAAGDINNDGLVDLYFTANSSPDKLYLNLGDLKFRDITEEAGILNLPGFNTGVTMADINGDGLLDIHVARGGWLDQNGQFDNLVYLNNGDLTFEEKAKEIGLADGNRTIQATFFDFDRDNDLDVYISNTPDITSRTKIVDLSKVHSNPKTMELKGSDRLYENDGNGHFTDISLKAGLYYDIGFGLNPQVGDLNNDGWLDIYVCNDFNYPDLAYINNADGTFKESSKTMFKHMSFNSMGSDFVDIDNDGQLDLLTLDMNPEDYKRAKLNMGMMPISQFEMMVDQGYHHQYVHNMLQMNNGNGSFSEISKMAGVADTDWSWAVLAADFNLDGLNDIFITNGIYRDVMNRDVIEKTMDILRSRGRKPTEQDFLEYTNMLPQQKLKNYFFKNNGNHTFSNSTNDWATISPSLSNGATYADLDNDGDLEIIVNNINQKATILKNNSIEQKYGDFIKINLEGKDQNTYGVGSKVTLVFDNHSIQSKELTNTRGFLSSVSNTLHFGLPKNKKPNKIIVQWADNSIKEYQKFNINQTNKLNYLEGVASTINKDLKKPIFEKQSYAFEHKEEYFNDYDLQKLLPHKLSQNGPGLAVGDINGDGNEEVYIGGGKNQAGQLIAFGESKESLLSIQTFENDKMYEDQSASFFDADGDGDLDLYVVSGSYENYRNTRFAQDRLYLNNGEGRFTKSLTALPEITSSGSVVVSGDFDNDGDLDLFVGGRVIPGQYPFMPSSYILQNNEGEFSRVEHKLAPELEKIGMVTDAQWVDINNDQFLDLVVTGEWMGIEIFVNESGAFKKSDAYRTLSKSIGWWNKIEVKDIDADGDLDIIAGNVGLNHKLKASYEDPLLIFANDYDRNGSVDIVIAKEIEGKNMPIRGKVDLAKQMPYLVNRIDTHEQFANLNLDEILGGKVGEPLYAATEFRSGIFINADNNSFTFQPFEDRIQQSVINSILFEDFDGDGIQDLLLAGNNYQTEVETTRGDSGIGSFLKGGEKGEFSLVSHLDSGFFVDKDVRNMSFLKSRKQARVVVANNNGVHDFFKLQFKSN
ncbi:VCBS repeat-containing protein [Maribacter sp. 1_MG-2023]|uniref:VCBS repeat-containing protein n=1 Tax=Maribacter sp. 1_MG-2023 TaxID=3062677 RepID=UPI0026E43ECC|nr:VCBS repeat-containing protein [Maribacter sp. 1_MG-2023]MDO6470452.1 VCBS repeat-containing protein [Maribacter sp. 1_MG-2023]